MRLKIPFIFCFIFLSVAAIAQPGSAPFPVAPSVPIDGLSGLLLAGGAAYGWYKLKKK